MKNMHSLDVDLIKEKLERLEHLEHHHRHCSVRVPGSAILRPLPISPKVPGNEPKASSKPDRCGPQFPASLATSSKYSQANQESETTKKPKRNIIRYDIPPPESPSEDQRWMREARAIIAMIPQGKDWRSRWNSLGVISGHDSKAVIADVLVTPSTSEGESAPKTTPLTNTSLNRKTSELFNRLSAYASVIVASRQAAELASRVTLFQELVFVSACTALKKHGLFSAVETRDILSHCIRDSTSPRYLDKIQSGALWVNQTINVLSWYGWGHRASPMFFLLNQTLTQYGRFTQASDSSREYFEERLIGEKYLEGVTTVPALEELSISHLVKCLIGNSLTHTQIDEALGYSAVKPRLVGPRLVTGKKRSYEGTSVHAEGSSNIMVYHSPAKTTHLAGQETHRENQHATGDILEESEVGCQPLNSSREPATISREPFLNSHTSDRADGAGPHTTRGVGYNATIGATHIQGLPQGSKDKRRCLGASDSTKAPQRRISAQSADKAASGKSSLSYDSESRPTESSTSLGVTDRVQAPPLSIESQHLCLDRDFNVSTEPFSTGPQHAFLMNTDRLLPAYPSNPSTWAPHDGNSLTSDIAEPQHAFLVNNDRLLPASPSDPSTWAPHDGNPLASNIPIGSLSTGAQHTYLVDPTRLDRLTPTSSSEVMGSAPSNARARNTYPYEVTPLHGIGPSLLSHTSGWNTRGENKGCHTHFKGTTWPDERSTQKYGWSYQAT